MEQILGTTPEYEATNAGEDNKPFVFQQLFPNTLNAKHSEVQCQAGFGSCFSEMDTGVGESFLLIRFIAA